MRIHQRTPRRTSLAHVPAEHIVKRVEISKGRYVIVDPDELASFAPLATKTIDVEQFVERAEIDPVFFDTTYYVAPAAGGAKPYALPVRALQSTGRWRSSGS